MKSVYRATTAAICAFLAGCAFAQSVSTDGTMLLDDATSRTRVVTNAFLNASNEVHGLIQSVSPKADFSTDNAELVETISTTVTNSASGYSDWVITPPSIDGTPIRIESEGSEGHYWMLIWRGSQYAQGYSYSTNLIYQLEGIEINAVRAVINTNMLGLAYLSDIKQSLTTNDVCNIVTNSVSFYTSTEYDKYNAWGIDQESATFNISYVEWVDPNTCTLIGNGVRYTIDTLDDSSSQTICIDRKVILYVENTYTDIPMLSMPDKWELRYEIPEVGFTDIATPLKLETQNSLGLARLTDIAPTVSNTVTKAYVEDLGIESGVDAHTVTNISYSITTNYVDNALTNRPTKAQLDEGWWSEWTYSGIPDGWHVDEEAHWDDLDEWFMSIRSEDGYSPSFAHGEANATTIAFHFEDDVSADVIATRHRVAAPVPTKISDIINDTGFVTASITNGLASTTITNGLASATITNGLIGADAISTNNAAFVAAVTNCPVVIADPGDISGWGAYGTVGALLAALAAAITGLRTSKEDASNKVTSLSAQSTDAQYPSAKCVWGMVGDVESALAAINGTENGGNA